MPTALITAGPTYEPLDAVRRLTNHSTGELGTELANHLEQNGVHVTLLRGHYATYAGPCSAAEQRPFTTTESLLEAFKSLAATKVDAIFHAAAVSDFRFGSVHSESAEDGHQSVGTGKLSTRSGNLIAQLVPTPKILRQLRSLFPNAFITGWKYEVEGDQVSAVEKSRQQLRDNQTDLSVTNGPAYGDGFALVTPNGDVRHVPDRPSLYTELLAACRR